MTTIQRFMSGKILHNNSLILTEDNMNEISDEKKAKILYQLCSPFIDKEQKDRIDTLLKMSNDNYKIVIKQMFKELIK